jgi:hypothetical protein
MSERMNELARAARLAYYNSPPVDEWDRLDAASREPWLRVAALRASQTPPHAVTREELWVIFVGFLGCNTLPNNSSDALWRMADEVLRQAAEKPAPTPPPIQESATAAVPLK